MPRRRRLLALASIALVTTFEPTLLAAAEVGPPTSSAHGSLLSQRDAKSNSSLHQQLRRKATLCDSSCPDDATYVSKIGLACADHRQFQCPMFLILGYNEDETAELIRRCPCTCGVDCAARNAGNGDDATSKINNAVSTPTGSPTLKNTLKPTPTPTLRPVTSIPTHFHDGVESHYFEPTLRPSLNPSSGGGSSDGIPYIIIGDRSEKSSSEGADISTNETVSTDQNNEEKPNMVLTTKQLLIICAGIAGLAFLSGVVFQLARGRSSSGEKDQEDTDEDFVIEVGHDGHRHRKGSGGCSTTACSSEMASEVQYFTYINRTVKNNRTVLAFEKNSNAWSKRLPFTKSYKAKRDEEKEQEKHMVNQNADIETGVQGGVAPATKHVEESYEDCEGPIPVIFSHDEDKTTPPPPKEPAPETKLQRNTGSANERSDKRSVSRSLGDQVNGDKQRGPKGRKENDDDESDVSKNGKVNSSENRRRRSNSASHRATRTYSHDYGEPRRKSHHHDHKRSRSRKYREQAGDCGLAGLGQCFDAENFDSYDTYDDYSALEKDMHLIEAKTTETYGHSYDYYGDERDDTFETFDQETVPSQRGYGKNDREADLTLSATRRRLEDNGGAWSKMLKRSLEDADDKYNCA